MAAVLAQKLLSEAGEPCAVQSAGVNAAPLCAASTHAVSAMRDAGCDLLAHRSQRATPQLITEAKLVLTMTSAHRVAVLSMVPNAGGKVFSLYGYAHGTDPAQTQFNNDVSDPFGGDFITYQQCAKQIEQLLISSMGKIIQHIREA